MRVTNSMITNSSQQHITNAKNLFLKYQTQFASQKKIQRPSDDPTIAVRALQLRTTYTQIRQYASKNVSDAMDWMDSTETALKNANTTLKNMKGYLNQGANDYLESDQRNSVLSVLQEYVSSIFEDEANTDYSGRYVFSGYRTDTSLIFPTDTDNLEYKISESFSSKAIDTIKYVTSNVGYVAGNGITDYSDQLASQDTAYRLQLSYRNCSNSAITGDNTVFNITTSYKNAAGTTVTDTLSSAVVSSDDPNAYDVDAYNKANGTNFDTIYLYDTGTVIFGAQAYSDVQMNNATISVDYTKKEFEKSDIRPEMYFGCTSYNTSTGRTINYSAPEKQDIRYEVNFSQTAVVNTQAKDAFDPQIYRAINYIEECVQAMDELEQKMSDVDKQIANSADEDEIAALKELQSRFEAEKKLRTEVMTEAFTKGLSMVSSTQDKLNVALADLGSRYNRLELTEDKLDDQSTNTEEKLSDNEDVDLTDAYINMTQADNLYQASLSATVNILGTSLLNYI